MNEREKQQDPSPNQQKIKAGLDKLAKDVVTSKKPQLEWSSLSMADRYRKGWSAAKATKPMWRQNEIDKSLKDGTFGEKHYDIEFSQLVASIAESDSPPEA